MFLEVKNLKTYFYNYDRELRAVDDLFLIRCIAASAWPSLVSPFRQDGQRIVHPAAGRYPPGLIMGGQIMFKGKDLLQMSDEGIARSAAPTSA